MLWFCLIVQEYTVHCVVWGCSGVAASLVLGMPKLVIEWAYIYAHWGSEALNLVSSIRWCTIK